MNWIILIIAGLFEVGFTTSLGKMREASGTSFYLWMGSFFCCLMISLLLLIYATKTLPLGTAYAVWTGIGAVGTVLVGIMFFREPVEFWRLFFVGALISSIIGVKFVSH